MKFSLPIVAFFLSSSAVAFGPATPLPSFGVSHGTSAREGMTMRISTNDMFRRQKMNQMLKVTSSSPAPKEYIEKELLSDDTSATIEKCNWKLRKAMIRKVKGQAFKFDVEVDPKFGKRATIVERLAAEQVSGAENKVKKEAINKAKAEVLAAQKVVREAAEAAAAEAAARKAAAPPPAPAPAPVVEAPPAPAPVISEPEPVVAEEPAAAPAGASVPVTVTLIKELRESTGAGMMDCKRALIDNDGDIEAASDFLRKSGLAKADKKAARIAAEGKIVAATLGQKSVVVEVNCETDFVAKDGSFLKYAAKVATAALAIDGENIDSLMASEIEGTSLEVERQALVSTIGENIQVRRMASMGGEGATTGSYVHMGKIGVLVELQGGTEQLAIDVGMHVAAMNPPFATSDQVPQEELEKERKMLTEQALESGKPEAIVEKMVDGRIRKYLEEICLDSQTYVKTNDKTVGELIEQAGAKLIGFKRIAVGEGIAKKEEDFAAEVAAASAGN